MTSQGESRCGANAHRSRLIVGSCRVVASLSMCHRQFRRAAGDLVIVVLAMSGILAAAHAGSGPVRAWYYRGSGYGTTSGTGYGEGSYGVPMEVSVPSDLGNCIRAAAGGGHFAAITVNGEVRAWGRNDHGQASPPPDLGLCTEIALGGTHTMALNKFGGIRAFGDNSRGQCSVPFGLGQYIAIAAGNEHSLAIRLNGQVRAWGSNSDGQANVPADLGACTRIAAGTVHSVALRANGTVRAWGANGSTCLDCDAGQTGINGLAGVRAIAAGGRASIAVLAGAKGAIGYGTLGFGCEPQFFDDYQQGFRSVAVGLYAFGLTIDGRVSGSGRLPGEQWWSPSSCVVGTGMPYDEFSNRGLPPNLGRCVQVASGQGGTAIAIVEADCNDDGIDDVLQLDEHDCDLNGRLDACDAAVGLLEDCNANGLGDECEKQVSIDASSGRRGPFGTPNTINWDIPAATPAIGTVRISGQVRGDLSSPTETVTVRIGSTVVAVLSWPYANDCAVQQFTVGDPWSGIDPEVFNSAISPAGTVRISFAPSVAVNPNLCPTGTWIEARLEYTGSAPADCNGNGVLDSCEIASGSTPDTNSNGRPDSCDSGFGGCTADLVVNGIVDGADLGELLAHWGPAAATTAADLNHDGTVNGADLGEVLANWGYCGN